MGPTFMINLEEGPTGRPASSRGQAPRHPNGHATDSAVRFSCRPRA
jgi:hypothetical protein